MEKSQHTDFNENTTKESVSMACSNVLMWKLDTWTEGRKTSKKGLRKILHVSWTTRKTNEWVLSKTGVRKELLKTVKAKKLVYYGHTIKKELPGERDNARKMPGARRWGKLHTAWMKNIKTCIGLTMEKTIRIAEDRDKWRKYVHGVANPQIEDG